MRRDPAYKFLVSAVDRAGVPWDVAWSKDPLETLDAADAYAKACPGVFVQALDTDAIDVDCSGGYWDSDDPIVERWLRTLLHSELVGLCMERHGVDFYGASLDTEALIDFLMADGKVVA